MQKIVRGQLIDIASKKIYKAEIEIENQRIKSITEKEHDETDYILPGFIDAHIHIESSMLTPFRFSQEAVKHGTVATISDPHEIANVNGLEGIHYMLESASKALMKIHFGAPSCVPATTFESAGAVLDSLAVYDLLRRNDIWYLSEMMNYPGVLYEDKEVWQKIAYAKQLNKPVDGHAPGLTGDQALQYIAAGITTDHECFTLSEALFKVQAGMKILIREGSAAKNFEALHPLLASYTPHVMFCSDDKHPDDFIHGHINKLVARAVAGGYNLFDVLTAACINPIKHYNIPVGMLRPGDYADFITVQDIVHFDVQATYINGEAAYKNGMVKEVVFNEGAINNFNCSYIKPEAVALATEKASLPCIHALDGQLITKRMDISPLRKGNNCISDVKNDFLKITVINRYRPQAPAVSFIHNFGIKNGAIASTVAHDSHNIIAVGCSDEEIARAVNLLIETKGGLSVVAGKYEEVLPLPVAGLMTTSTCSQIAKQYALLDAKVKENGSKLRAPFMTLSFMALLVIPELKLSDLGLFDAVKFQFAE
ncbi:MAG: adenine deaminase [Bacteroidetes bacterium]|nr:adenine deaminase [Bacteroidota bacterium]